MIVAARPELWLNAIAGDGEGGREWDAIGRVEEQNGAESDWEGEWSDWEGEWSDWEGEWSDWEGEWSDCGSGRARDNNQVDLPWL